MKARLTKTRTLALMLALVLCLATGPQAADWWERIEFKGDFRYRHEMIKKTDTDARHRQRIRARIGLYTKVSDYTSFGFQLATGSDDPTSTNQTLDDAAGTKQIGVDLAYFEGRHQALPCFTLTAGKFKNPFFKAGKSELIWDGDWNPEGGALTMHRECEKFEWTLIGSGLWIEERSSDPNSFVVAAQAVGRLFINDKKSSVAIAGGFFAYTNVEGYLPFHNSEKSKGNSTVEHSVDIDSTIVLYTTDFDLFELSGELTHSINRTPFTLLADYVQNTAADSLETGWLVGVRVGKTKSPGSWAFRYNYRRLEKDAVVGAFSNSDFGGGGTDAKGHEIGGSVMLAKTTTLAVTYITADNDLKSDTANDYSQLQLDLNLKF